MNIRVCEKCGLELDSGVTSSKELKYKHKNYKFYYLKCRSCGTLRSYTFVNSKGLSNILGITIQTVYSYVSKGIPHRHIKYTYEGYNERLSFNLEDVYEWLKINIPNRSKVLELYFENAN